MQIFIQENAFENVICEMAAILFQSWCVNPCHAEFILGNINIFLHFPSFHDTTMVQDVWKFLLTSCIVITRAADGMEIWEILFPEISAEKTTQSSNCVIVVYQIVIKLTKQII